MRDIATRRAHKDRLRDKYTRLIARHGLWGGAPLTPRYLAHIVETHMRPCSCLMCKRGDRAKHKAELARLASTTQE